MAEQVATDGFNVPPVPAGASERQPSTANMQPGFAPPAPPAPASQGLSQDEVAKQIADALAAAKPAPVVPPAQQPAFNFAEDMGDDPVLASLNSIFASTVPGIDIERALGKALSFGRTDLIDVAYLNEKGGVNAAHLNTLAKAIVERVQTQTDEAASNVYSTAGGKEQWDAAAAVFDKNAPAHLKTVIARLLDSGNRSAVSQAAQTVVDYVKQNGLVPNPAQLVQAGGAALGSAQALSKADFQAAHAKLDPNSRSYQQDRNNLFARRQLGKQLGQ